MRDFKIYVGTKKDSVYVQTILFTLGYKWLNGENTFAILVKEEHLFVEGGVISFASHDDFINSNLRQVDIDYLEMLLDKRYLGSDIKRGEVDVNEEVIFLLKQGLLFK